MKYTRTAILLHWAMAVLIFSQLALGWWLVLSHPDGAGARPNAAHLHRTIGFLLGALLVFRVAWRLQHQTPLPPRTMPEWQATVAKMTHMALYLLMLMMPLSGFLAASFGPGPFQMLGVTLPNWAGSDREVHDFFTGLHFATAMLLSVLVAVHVIAALKHWLIDRDQVMSRMLP